MCAAVVTHESVLHDSGLSRMRSKRMTAFGFGSAQLDGLTAPDGNEGNDGALTQDQDVLLVYLSVFLPAYPRPRISAVTSLYVPHGTP